MASAAHFAGVLVACYPAILLLTGSRWTWRSPRVAIVCWQAVGLTLGLSAIGLPLAYALAPYHRGTLPAVGHFVVDALRGRLPHGIGPTQLAALGIGLMVAAWLIGTTVTCLVRTLRVRSRHRQLLTLVARDDPAAPGALVLDHPSVAAYCLPGVLRSRVVVSAGTLSLLDRAELAAVLSHERAHADERHDLVLLPFNALCRTLPQVHWLRGAHRALAAAHEAVALLVEMRADDKARRLHTGGPLAAALVRLATGPGTLTPPGALGIAGSDLPAGGDPAAEPDRPTVPQRAEVPPADRHLEARLHRLLHTGRTPWLSRTVALAAAATLVSVSLSLFI